MGELIVFCPAPGKSMEDSLKVANVSNKGVEQKGVNYH